MRRIYLGQTVIQERATGNLLYFRYKKIKLKKEDPTFKETYGWQQHGVINHYDRIW